VGRRPGRAVRGGPGWELPFQTWLRRVHPDDLERVIATFAEFQPAEETYRLVLDDGSIRYVLSRATQIVHDDSGVPMKMVGVMIDVTTGHEAGARMQDMLESMSDGFMSLDREFRILFVNPGPSCCWGWSGGSCWGRACSRCSPRPVGPGSRPPTRR
jgi:hypothetical protein